MTSFPRPEGVGGRAATTGSSSHHLNGHQPLEEEHPEMVIAYAAAALCGILFGLALGYLFFA